MDSETNANGMLPLDSPESSDKVEPTLAASAASDSMAKSRQPKEETKDKVSARYYLRGFSFIVLMAVSILFSGSLYVLVHGINLLELLSRPQQRPVFDFVGGQSNPFAIGLEISFWSFFGVTCQMAYETVHATLERKFVFWRQLIKWSGTALFAIGIASAVIFSLRIISLNIGGVEIPLTKASLEAIIAIAFVLGFYNEEARRLLSKLLPQIGVDKADQDAPLKNK